MFLGEDLDLQKAWKRLIVISFMMMVPFFVGLLWFGFSNMPEMYPLWDSMNVMLFLVVSNFLVRVELGSTMLFRVVNVFGLAVDLMPVMFFWIVYAVVGAYCWIFARLARDGSFWVAPLLTRPSERYQTFGEAKKRLGQIIRSGSSAEKSALCFFVIFYVVGSSTVMLFILLCFAGIFELLEGFLLLLVFLLLNAIPEWVLWSKIR